MATSEVKWYRRNLVILISLCVGVGWFGWQVWRDGQLRWKPAPAPQASTPIAEILSDLAITLSGAKGESTLTFGPNQRTYSLPRPTKGQALTIDIEGIGRFRIGEGLPATVPLFDVHWMNKQGSVYLQWECADHPAIYGSYTYSRWLREIPDTESATGRRCRGSSRE